MNKLRITAFVLVGTLALGSCSKQWLEDYQADETRPVDVPVSVLLPSAQADYSYAQGDVLPRLTSIFMQQMTGTDRQSAAHNRYAQIGESDFDVVFSTNGYSGGMMDLQLIIDKANDQGAPHYSGVAKIMMAQYLGLFTDVWGDIPFAEALKGADNLNPAYESQEAIYGHIQRLLTEGATECGAASSNLTPGSDDYYFGGDMGMWIKHAWSLKARYYNHLSKTSVFDGDAVLNAMANGYMSSADDAEQPFGSSRTSSNPWYKFTKEDREGYITQYGFMYDAMTAASDPRLDFYRSSDSTGMPYYGSPTSTLPICTYHELKYIEAEVKMGKNDAAGARAALVDAITANMDKIGVSAADRDAYLATLPATVDMETIMYEKYIAMFSQVEAWTDWRRTGYPGITVYPGANLTEIPRRMPYPESERLYNDNFINLSTPEQQFGVGTANRLWWDK